MSGSVKPIVAVSGLRFAYGSKVVLAGLDLAVRAGEVYALLGGNGAGKSTLLNLLLGFAAPAAGTVQVCGFDTVRDADKVRASLAYVPESVALYEHLTARENLDYFLSLARSPHDRRTVVDPALEAVGLAPEAWSRRVGGFSKGMRQKVAIALALAREVPLLVLDEPTSGLDPRATGDFNRLLETARGRGVATLMVTHDILSAVDVADRIGFLAHGRVEEEVASKEAEGFDVRRLHQHYGLSGTAA